MQVASGDTAFFGIMRNPSEATQMQDGFKHLAFFSSEGLQKGPLDVKKCRLLEAIQRFLASRATLFMLMNSPLEVEGCRI